MSQVAGSPGSPGSVTDEYARAGFGGAARRGQRPALVVVDLTCGFTRPEHPTGADLTSVVEATNDLVGVARAHRVPVVFTAIAYSSRLEAQVWLRKAPGLAALRAGSDAVAFDDRLDVASDDPVVIKHGASAFFGTGLAPLLVGAGVDTVVISGATTSGCVRATVVDAVQHGFDVLVPREAVGDRAAAPHDASLFDMQAKYADVVAHREAMDYLATSHSHQEALS